jgi:hypothetical protein
MAVGVMDIGVAAAGATAVGATAVGATEVGVTAEEAVGATEVGVTAEEAVGATAEVAADTVEPQGSAGNKCCSGGTVAPAIMVGEGLPSTDLRVSAASHGWSACAEYDVA